MKLLKFIPLQLTLALVLGILTGYLFTFSTYTISIVLIFKFLLLGFIYFFEKNRLSLSAAYPIVTLLLFFVIGIACVSFQNDLNKKGHYTVSDFSESNSHSILLSIHSQLRSSLFHHKFNAKILQLNGQKTHGKILLNISKDSIKPKFSIGDKILVRARLIEVNAPKNPYQFNYKKYLERQHIYRQINISNQEYIVLNSKQNNPNSIAGKFRKRVNKSLEKAGFKDNELSIINALLLGQRQEISKELIENYTKAGAIHILAISGLHVGIILLLFNFILKPLDYLKNGKTIKLVAAIILLWSFAFIAGLSASVIRAVAMFTAIAISILGKRKSNVYQNLVISMFFLLLVNPMYILDVGFQLSYLAVFFIVWLHPIISSLWQPRWKIVNYFWEILTVSLAAQIGVLPLSIYYFHQFPGLFFITNLVILPVLGFTLGLGLLVIFLSLANLLPELLAIAFQKVITFMNQFIGWIAGQESFLFQNISFSVVLMITSYLFIIFSFRWIEHKSYLRFKYVLLTLLLVQSVFIYEKWTVLSKTELIIFNKSKASIVGERTGNQLSLYHSLDDLNISDNLVRSYTIGSNIKSISFTNSINKSIFFDKNILLIDSLGSYQIKSFQPKSVLLIQSPKVNLERLIETVHPKQIIADNSNFKGYVKRWQQTCNQHKIPFYYTNEIGAYVLSE